MPNPIELPYPLRHGDEDEIVAQVDDIIAAVRPDSGATIVFTPPDRHYNPVELGLAVELVLSRGDLKARYTSVYPDY